MTQAALLFRVDTEDTQRKCGYVAEGGVRQPRQAVWDGKEFQAEQKPAEKLDAKTGTGSSCSRYYFRNRVLDKVRYSAKRENVCHKASKLRFCSFWVLICGPGLKDWFKGIVPGKRAREMASWFLCRAKEDLPMSLTDRVAR